MSMSSGKPWLYSPTANLSLSDPRCNNDSCKAFYDAHQLSQRQVSYSFQFKYGQFTTWYYLAWIGIFTVACYYQRWLSISPPAVNSNSYLWLPRALGLWRSIAYRRATGRFGHQFGLPSLGLILFFVLAALYLCLLTFTARPYYRQHRGYGSPPIGVRTGLMADALTPLVIALSGKANVVSFLTGFGHEKLNVIHRWASWMMFALSVVHTIPFIVAPLHDGGYAALRKQFYKPGSLEYTGTPALAILFGMILLASPWFRHRIYEGFYWVHFSFAATYTGLMFWHAKNEGDSWVYLWATLAVWLLQILVRIFWYVQPMKVTVQPWAIGSPVSAHLVSDDMVLLSVLAPKDFTWTPGQHIFLRMPGVAPLHNHPFTIASMCSNDRYLRLMIRARAGFTHRLLAYLGASPDHPLEAWIEGPYGGIGYRPETRFDEVVLVCGGGGISACLPWLQHFDCLYKAGKCHRLQRVRLIWSIRSASAIAWISDVMDAIDFKAISTITIHLTQDRIPYTIKEENDQIKAEEKTLAMSHSSYMGYEEGRIDMNLIFRDLRKHSRTLVIGCGPESFKVDLSNASARAQSQVISGSVQEIALHTETFGW